MSIQSSSADRAVSPAQVWPPLAADLQRRAILLMAELAFNLVTAQPRWPNQESNYAFQLNSPPDHP